jgi:hypothetical protein
LPGYRNRRARRSQIRNVKLIRDNTDVDEEFEILGLIGQGYVNS